MWVAVFTCMISCCRDTKLLFFNSCNALDQLRGGASFTDQVHRCIADRSGHQVLLYDQVHWCTAPWAGVQLYRSMIKCTDEPLHDLVHRYTALWPGAQMYRSMNRCAGAPLYDQEHRCTTLWSGAQVHHSVTKCTDALQSLLEIYFAAAVRDKICTFGNMIDKPISKWQSLFDVFITEILKLNLLHPK